MKKKKELFSYSKLTTFKTCPYSYYLTYILHYPRKDNVYSFMGTKIHSLLEDLQEGKITKDVAVKEFKKTVRQSEMLGYSFPTEKSGKNFVDCMILYFENYTPFEKVTDYKVEEYFEVDIGAVTMRGYIDIYTITDDKYIDVYDYKSSSKFNKKTLEEKQMQLIIYALALKEKYPDKIIRSLNFDMCKYAKNSNGALVERNKSKRQNVRGFVKVDFSEKNIKDTKDFIEKTYKEISSLDVSNENEWKANVNKFFCKNLCSNHNDCPFSQ